MTNLITIANLTLSLICNQPDGWQLQAHTEALAPDLQEVTINLSRTSPAELPAFTLNCALPQHDIHAVWNPIADRFSIPPNWTSPSWSTLASGAPLRALISDSNRNRLTLATSEAKRDLSFKMGLNEELCCVDIGIGYPKGGNEPCTNYQVKVRLDLRREVFWSDAIQEAALWLNHQPGLTPAVPPADAFAPLYSTWYNFHQEVTDVAIEQECRLASQLGMKVLIVDDGWQTDDNARGYAYCGDWVVSTNRFKDFKAHVKRIQAMGMKYMLWYSVPFVGKQSANYQRFKGKYLYDAHGMGASVLDPRFPEVREFLASTYETMMREYGIDGFKLDFIDSISCRQDDPAPKENYKGRDCQSIPEGVDRLLRDVTQRLKRLNPNVLIEFRQSYVGPSIRKYGNMMRAADCPADHNINRIRTTNLRLSSPGSAIHSDMLEWHTTESAEQAARQILSVLFSVVQYSRTLGELSPSHLAMVRHWLDFSQAHKDALLYGKFRAYHPQAGYPILEAEGQTERVIGVYQSHVALPIPASPKRTYVINGTGVDGLTLLYPDAKPRSVKIYDTFGKPVKGEIVPTSGYAEIQF